MKFKKILFLFITLQFLLFTAHSYADDTDLYVGNYSAIEPNILIIFDNSGSMGDRLTQVKTYCEYKPTFSYPQPPGIPNVDPAKVYRMSSGQWFKSGSPTVYKNSVSQVPCVEAQTELTKYNDGVFNGRPDNENCSSGTSRTIATGNWLRFNYATEENKEDCKTKLEIAQDVIKDFLGSVQGVRVGVMRFNDKITYPDDSWDYEGGKLLKEIVSLDSTTRQQLKDIIDGIDDGGYTPLAENFMRQGPILRVVQAIFLQG